MEPGILLALVVAAFLAAFIDSIVGGGGVITLPALLAAGLPPHLALGTNKLAATGASLMATARYTAAGHVDLRTALSLIPLSVVGAFLGAAAVLAVEARLVRSLVIVVMVAMTLYVLLRPSLGRDDRFPGLTPGLFLALGAPALLIGFYDGFLGPGTGSLLLFAFLGIGGFGFLRAAAHGRILNFASNLAALALFALRDQVDYQVGLPMMAAMLGGAYFGSHFGMRHGTRWVKPLFLAMTLAILARLLWL